MSEQHDPAPWVLQDNASFGIHVYSKGGAFGGGKHLAKISNSAGANPHANARLIAAAPELLDALRGLYDYARGWPAEDSSRFHRLLEQADAALTKATGGDR